MINAQRSILLVDDDDLFKNRLVKTLARLGHHVLSASNYRGAVEIIAQQKPEYAIVELKLSGKSGLDVIRTGIRHQPDIRILVLTGYGSIATATDAIKLGAVDYLTKPADIEKIMNALLNIKALKSDKPIHTPSLARVEWEHINRILNDCDNNISMAAKKLGIHRRTLQRKLQKSPPLI